MFDNSLFFSEMADEKTNILQKLQLTSGKFILATIHRNNNTDESARLNSLFKSLNDISVDHGLEVVLPLHPRTAKLLKQNLHGQIYNAIQNNPSFKITEPASFLEMIALEKNCCLVMTDSGGVQKEAFYFQKACVILRPETEWVELIDCGTAIVADANETRIKEAFEKLYHKKDLSYPPLYGDGKAAEFICREILQHIH
jgi:UDP-GlcNAc3NAcA epimerase